MIIIGSVKYVIIHANNVKRNNPINGAANVIIISFYIII
jgi:hypothetical protein